VRAIAWVSTEVRLDRDAVIVHQYNSVVPSISYRLGGTQKQTVVPSASCWQGGTQNKPDDEDLRVLKRRALWIDHRPAILRDGGSVFLTESLILAQDERWRRA
jgi:hypothetical protein